MVGKWFGFEKEEVFEEGLARLEAGDYEEASKAFEACKQEDPSDQRFEGHLGQCYTKLAEQALSNERFFEAAAMSVNALVIEPHSVDLHLIAAKAFRGLRRGRIARFHLEKVRWLRRRRRQEAASAWAAAQPAYE